MLVGEGFWRGAVLWGRTLGEALETGASRLGRCEVSRVQGRSGGRDDHHCCGRGALRNKDSRLAVGEAEDIPGLVGACSGMAEREGFEPSVR